MSEIKKYDISKERYREYQYKDGYILRIDAPNHLYITQDGGHRVADHNDVTHYIPKGWRELRWKMDPSDGHLIF